MPLYNYNILYHTIIIKSRKIFKDFGFLHTFEKIFENLKINVEIAHKL